MIRLHPEEIQGAKVWLANGQMVGTWSSGLMFASELLRRCSHSPSLRKGNRKGLILNVKQRHSFGSVSTSFYKKGREDGSILKEVVAPNPWHSLVQLKEQLPPTK